MEGKQIFQRASLPFPFCSIFVYIIFKAFSCHLRSSGRHRGLDLLFYSLFHQWASKMASELISQLSRHKLPYKLTITSWLATVSKHQLMVNLCCSPLLDCFLCDSRSLLLAVLCLFWPYMGPWGPPLARYPSQPVATLQQFASTLTSPQQWKSIRILCEVDNYTVLAWLTGLHSSQPGCPHWFQPRALSSQQFVALSALKQCPNGLVLAWLYCARRIGKSMHWPVTTRSHR